jgi:divalent metal cation (Fe/Co/Zn/Cd) transporter
VDAIVAERLLALQRGRRLELLTIGWNVLEAFVSLFAGYLAGSIALVGFGFDSAIEVAAAILLLWWLGSSAAKTGASERRVLRYVAVSFMLLGIYISADSLYALLTQRMPETSVPGVAITAISLAVMPLLARSKRHVAAQLGSSALSSESKQTQICAYLSAVTLAGLLLNWVLGWWWADPVAALAMVPLVLHEAAEAWRGRSCCDDVKC